MARTGERTLKPHHGCVQLRADIAARLEFLEKGILEILSNATNGLSVVLEHRYYGDSVPVSSLSTDDLRFLNNAEALEDSGYVSR